MMLPVWLCGLRGLWKECFLPIHVELLRLWKTNGSLWLSQYLSAASRAIVLWVGGDRLDQSKSGVRISLTRAGLPLLLPGALRAVLHQINGENHIHALAALKVTLSVLSVYRVIGCDPMLKLETITGPFTGVGATLSFWEVSSAVGLLPRSLVLTKVVWTYLSESAGPNFKHSTWSAGLDAMAFLADPFTWYQWLAVAAGQRAWGMIAWNLFTIVGTLPLVPVLLFCKKYPKYLGRLVKLYEARGKVRVVAITDWWTQCLLMPLHEGIFDILRAIPQDGTFDQLAPVHRLMSYVRAAGAPVYSYDLSAATDRLPVWVQAQFLAELGVSWASNWASLLVIRPWYLDKKPVHYAVGQPIGALSSWAMLALCHHLLVQVAARRVGYKEWFPYYALLGDDIIIAEESVAMAYRTLMEDLGVTINLSKSFEMKSGTLEFAKRWFHPNLGDLSPIGPGLILAALRNPRLIAVLIQDALNRNFVIPTRVVGDLYRYIKIIRPANWIKRSWLPILSSVIGPDGGLWGAASGPLYKAAWIKLFPHHTRNKLQSLLDTLYQQISTSSELPSSRETLMAQLVSRFWKAADLFRGSLSGLVSMALVILSPAFWVYYELANGAEERIARFSAARDRLDRVLLNSWAGDGLDLAIRFKALRNFLRVNFDPDLLNWDRKAAEAILSRHVNLFKLWDIEFRNREELTQMIFDAMPEVVDPYADWVDPDDMDELDESVQSLAIVPAGYWVTSGKLIGRRHDSMDPPGVAKLR